MALYSVTGETVTTPYTVRGEPAVCGFDAQRQPLYRNGPLRVMTYNVQRWSGKNAVRAYQDAAFGHNADIIGMQEWGRRYHMQMDGMDAGEYIRRFGYGYEFVATLDVTHNALASRYDMTTEEHQFVNINPAEPTGYTKSTLSFGGKTIAVYNTHLSAYAQNKAYRFAQAQELLAAVAQDTYFILLGDLNCPSTVKNGGEPDSPYNDENFKNIVLPFITAGYHVANSPGDDPLIWTYYSGATAAESVTTPPDNIICSANITMQNVHTINAKLAADDGMAIDHIPLVADLVIQ